MNFLVGHHWLWVAAGVLLCAVEVFAPGMFMLWIGLAAIATGLILSVVDLAFAWTLLLFGALSVAMVLAGRKVYGSAQTSGDQPFLNRRADAMVGKTYVLAAPIKAGVGSIKVNDSVWRVQGPDMPAGVRVRVTGVEDAMVLLVEQA